MSDPIRAGQALHIVRPLHTPEEWAQLDAEAAADEAAHRREADAPYRPEAHALQAGIPPRWRRMFAGAHQRETPATSAVERFLAGSARVLILTGAPSTGKTTAALWGAWRLCCEASQRHERAGAAYPGRRAATDGPHEAVRAPGVRYLRAPDLHRVGLEDALFDELSRTPLLVLDDLGWQHAGKTEWAMATLGRLLDVREGEDGRMLCCTNYSREALRESLGANEGERARNWRRLDGDAPGTIFAPGVR